MTETHKGQCYCGKVQITLSGPPRVSALCHCRDCQAWQAAPINAWHAWATDRVEIDGEIRVSDQHPASARISCAACGGAVANRKPLRGITILYAALLHETPFTPTMHIFYAERMMDIADGLPKFADMPEALGGSNLRLEEPTATGFL